MLSINVTAKVLESPLFTVGNSWTYTDVVSDTQQSTLLRKVIGQTTFNGNACYEIDSTLAGTTGFVSKNYYGLDTAGEYVTYGDQSSGPQFQQTRVYSPYEVGFPSIISAGTTYSFSCTETDSSTNASGGVTTTNFGVDNTVSLVSETPTTFMLNGSSYQQYQVNTSETKTDSANNANTTMETDYDSPTLGLVKAVTPGSPVTLTVASFNGTQDHLTLTPAQIVTTAAGKTLAPVVIDVLDSNNNPDTAATGSITLTLANAPQTPISSGTLGGTLSEPIVSGSATFSDLTVSADGVYVLTANDTKGDTPAISANFKIGQGLLVLRGPKNTDAGEKIAPPVQIEILNERGRRDTTATTAITVALASSSSGTGTLTGTTTINAVAGVATFRDLRIDKPGIYSLTFSDSGASTVNSAPFQITGNKLVFRRRISNGIEGSAIHPAIMVGLVDVRGRRITDGSSVVTLAITRIGPNGSGTITGITAQMVNGVAVFSSLKFSQPGTYTIVATDAQDADSPGQDITITGLHLAFKIQPSEVGVNAPLKYKIAVEDYRNRLVNTSSIGLGLTLNIVSDGANAALSSVADTVDFGLAVNSGANPAAINAVGRYTITFTVISQSVDAFDFTIDPVTSRPFQVVANHLAFVREPHNSVVNRALVYVVEVKDFRNHLVSSMDQLNIALIPVRGGTGAALTANVDTFFGGMATNTGPVPIAVTGVGSYMLSATDVPADPNNPVPAAVTSRVFSIRQVASI